MAHGKAKLVSLEVHQGAVKLPRGEPGKRDFFWFVLFSASFSSEENVQLSKVNSGINVVEQGD